MMKFETMAIKLGNATSICTSETGTSENVSDTIAMIDTGTKTEDMTAAAQNTPITFFTVLKFIRITYLSLYLPFLGTKGDPAVNRSIGHLLLVSYPLRLARQSRAILEKREDALKDSVRQPDTLRKVFSLWGRIRLEPVAKAAPERRGSAEPQQLLPNFWRFNVSITLKDGSGAVSRKSLEDYISDRFLDLVEEKPFYSIKVKELVEYSSIARSTFYAHFDSIFDVVQRMEDRFLEDFYPIESARQVLLEGSSLGAAMQSRYVMENARVVDLLTGPNGDPYFSKRLEKHIEDICHRIWAESEPSYSEEEKNAFAAYIAGGTLALIRIEARQAISNKAAAPSRRTSETIIAANSILLGQASGWTPGKRSAPEAGRAASPGTKNGR